MRTTNIAVCSATKNTMKTIQIVITAILLLSLTSAITIIAGTNHTINFSGEVSECYILNNQSDLEGLNLTENGNDIIIKTIVNYKPDNFTISCLVKMVREEYSNGNGGSSGESNGGSSGGSCKYNENYDWECENWGKCINEIKTRKCNEYNNCRSTWGRPIVTQTCIQIIESTDPIIINIIYEKDPTFSIWHIIIAIISLLILVWLIRLIQTLRMFDTIKEELN